MEATSFCQECPCVAGNGRRGYHMSYIKAKPTSKPGESPEPFACAFCDHTSEPVTEEKAFKAPALVPPPPAQATVQYERSGYNGAHFLMIDRSSVGQVFIAGLFTPGMDGREALSLRFMDRDGMHDFRLDVDELEEFRAWIAKRPGSGS